MLVALSLESTNPLLVAPAPRIEEVNNKHVFCQIDTGELGLTYAIARFGESLGGNRISVERTVMVAYSSIDNAGQMIWRDKNNDGFPEQYCTGDYMQPENCREASKLEKKLYSRMKKLDHSLCVASESSLLRRLDE